MSRQCLAVTVGPRPGARTESPFAVAADERKYRNLSYRLLALPLGLAAFATVAASYGLAIGLLLAPVTYRFDTIVTNIGPVRVDSFEEAVVCFLVAPLAILGAMHVSNALAPARRFARLMLAPDG